MRAGHSAGVKTCIRCNCDKPLLLFAKDAQRKDGFSPYCKDCHDAARRASYRGSTDKAAHRARVADWRAKNLEKARELSRATHARHSEKRNAASVKYREENREHTRALCRKWAKDNAAKMLLTNADRRAKKHQATPAWAGDEFDRFVVAEAYDIAKKRTVATGIKWHVDHMVPLRNKLVCGFHCAANISVIPAVENHIKGNRTWPDMWT
jgi:hypothetical protein